MIEINQQLSLLINEQLVKEDNAEHFRFSNTYTYEQLHKIETLEINNLTSLKDIDKLPNLKVLKLISEDYNKFASFIDLEVNTLINHIKNFKHIENLENLEQLEIINDINIKRLDLLKLKKLKSLVLINNPNLETLKNLDSLPSLENVVIYGTNINSRINFDKYLFNTYTAQTNILDINMYHKIVKGDINNAEKISWLYRLGYNNIEFAEKTGFLDKSIINPTEAYEMYNKAVQVIKDYNAHQFDDYKKIKFVYDYVVSSVKYDELGITYRDRKYLDVIRNHDLRDYNKNDFTKLHSSYNASIMGKSNCEGYVNLMRFMFQMLGIKSKNVYCAKKDSDAIAFYNHSIIKVQYNDGWYYCEPTWERPGSFQYFMLNYEQITQTHILNPLELKNNKEVVKDGDNFRYN